MVRVSGDEMEDTTFLVMAGMGFDAAIMEGVNENFKKQGRLAGLRLVGAEVADVPAQSRWRSPSTAASSPRIGLARS